MGKGVGASASPRHREEGEPEGLVGCLDNGPRLEAEGVAVLLKRAYRGLQGRWGRVRGTYPEGVSEELDQEVGGVPGGVSAPPRAPSRARQRVQADSPAG